MGSIRGEGGAGGGGGGGLADLVDDTTPQLGGNLDVNGHNVGGVTPTELGYLSGVSSAVQTQLDAKATSAALTSGLAGKQDADAELTALAGLTSAADKGIQFTGSGTAATYDLTAAGKALLDDADAAAQRTTLGLGTAATAASGDFQAASANLSALAGQTGAADKVSYWTAAATLALATLTAFGRSLIAAADAAGVRTLLGLGTGDTPTFTGAIIGGATSIGGALRVQAGGGSIAAFETTGSGGIRLNTTTAGGSPYLQFDRQSSGRMWAQLTTGTNDIDWFNASGVQVLRIGQTTGIHASRFTSEVATGTAPFTVASTTVVSNLNADKLDGKDATDFAPCTQSTLTAAASVALDFAAAGLATLTTDQNTTFTTSNRAANRQPYNLRIIGGGAHTLTFPAGWKWLNSTMPAAIASGKTGRLCLECYGTADTDIVASFAVEA